MELNKSDLDKIIKYLEKYSPDGPECSMCGNNNWNVNDKLLELKEYHGINIYGSGVQVPVIMVSCEKCGNMIFLSAMVAGIINDKGEKIE
jgi:hypothetical protein